MKRKLISLILVLAMCLSMITVTSATNAAVPHEAQTAAEALYQLGLFRGTGTDSEGNPVFSLEKSMNRQEAVTMLVRLLGKEEEALNGTWEIPFTDVANWAKPYVGYAYANGLTNGISATKFDGTSSVTATQYLTFVLRALGYDSSADFSWKRAWELSDKIGLTSGQYNAANNASFLRGDSAVISYSGLKTELKDTTVKLVDKMVEAGVVDAVKAGTLGLMGYKAPTYLTIQDMSTWSISNSELQVGQCAQLFVTTSPAGAASGITWKSSNPSVAYVDEWGKVTALKKGTVTITATTYNNVQATYTINVPKDLAELEYQLTADGKGYEVIGGDVNAYTAHIPAVYNGLPVVSIKGGAFKDCAKLRYFTVDAQQKTFYADGGVIFTNMPEKTLVCFPPSYDVADYYYVPKDTVAVASYAFAGLQTLQTLTLQDGLQALGDYVFCEIGKESFHYFNLSIYAPASLAKIGVHLMQDQSRNVAFYADRETAVARYASQNQIPCGYIVPNFQGDATTADLGAPVSLSADKLIPTNEKNVVYYQGVSANTYHGYSDLASKVVDLSEYQQGHDGEVRVLLEQVWNAILPDPYGNTALDCSVQTGLYGAGCTEGEAILRGYDRSGNLIAMQYISGDFAFSFPGAVNFGVEGGRNTKLTAVPVEPVYVASAGTYNLDLTQWHRDAEGHLFQYFILELSHATNTTQFALHLNLLGYSFSDATTGKGLVNSESTPRYSILRCILRDVSRVEQMSAVSLVFDGFECIWEDEHVKCMISSLIDPAEGFGQRVSALAEKVKQIMLGTYIPDSISVHQILIDSSASWSPTATGGNIQLSEEEVREFSEHTIAHEMVHAIDQNIATVALGFYAPSPWMEGRAEYISAVVLGRDGNPGDYDWSFLSDTDKADFFHYYYYSTNRFTEYDVGHQFFYYLLQTYGEDVSAEIMANIAALPEIDEYTKVTDEMQEECAQMFKECVENATEVGVFQNFVRDVIEK